MDDAATTPSRIPSVQRSPHLSSRVAGSTIREGDLPLSLLVGYSPSLLCTLANIYRNNKKHFQ